MKLKVMKNARWLFFCAAFVGSLANASGQRQDSLEFPASWEGEWAGTLQIYNAKGLAQELPMELHILPTDSAWHTYRIIYGEDKVAGLRDYQLKPLRPELGIYMIDEQNTIAMEANYIGGALYSRFEVMGSLLLSTAYLVDEGELHYEIISGKHESVRASGGQSYEGEDIPEVNAFPVQVRQVARLQRRGH